MNRKKLSEIRRLWSRRRALGGLASLGMGVAGCKVEVNADEGTSGNDSTTTGGTTTSTTGGTSSEGSSTAADESSSSSTGDTGPIMSDCEAAGSLSFEELVAPIEHVIVLMMENRSFDHMFGALALEGRTIDGLTGNESNPSADGDVQVFLLTDSAAVAVDPNHSWDGSHEQWNSGANDGFVMSYAAKGSPDPTLVMGYFDRSTLPISYALADNYSICDRWFCSVMGPTWPNRFYLHMGTSGGMQTNDGVSDIPSIWDRLDAAGITNTYYNSNAPFTLTFGKATGVEKIAAFYDALADGSLPQFCMVDPAFADFATDIADANDDHPPADVAMGQAFLATVYAAIAASPLWNTTLLVITYDEHGGFYDHVSPPTTTDDMPDFEQLGFRVPALVIGPHVRRGCVNSTQLEHTSVLKTVIQKWGLDPLTSRVDAAADLSSCIDPSFVDDPQPPAQLPMMIVRRPQPNLAQSSGKSHDELFALCDRHGIGPAERAKAAREAIEAMFAWGQKLGALKVIE